MEKYTKIFSAAVQNAQKIRELFVRLKYGLKWGFSVLYDGTLSNKDY